MTEHGPGGRPDATYLSNPDVDRFHAALLEATEDTAYVVERDEHGFVVRLELADAKWWGVLNRAGLRQEVAQLVRFPREGVFTVTDRISRVEWSAGVPTRFAMEASYGRVVAWKKVEKVWALDDRGRLGKVVDISYDAGEARRLVEATGKALGLEQRAGWQERTAIGFAVFAIVGLVLGGLVVLVLWLVGVI
jgi:hypothetical protein